MYNPNLNGPKVIHFKLDSIRVLLETKTLRKFKPKCFSHGQFKLENVSQVISFIDLSMG